MGEGGQRATPSVTKIVGGEMAARVRAFDWSKTPLGPREDWSPALRLATDIVLASNFPMALRWGPELVLIYNDGYAPALHERHPSALGQSFYDTTPEFQAALRELHQDILTGTSGGFAFERLPLKVLNNGVLEAAYFTVNYSPVPDETAPNGIGGVLVAAVEISQSVKAEQTLRATQERYQMAREVAGVVGAWEWDMKADKVYADARYAELHNVDPALAERGLPVQAFLPALHPDDRDRIRAIAQSSAANGEAFSEEYRLIQADGSIRWVYTRGKAYLDADGQPARNTGVIIDVTERKKAEAELAAARVDLDLAAQAAGLGRWVLRPSVNQRHWDARARAIFGLTEHEPPSTARFLSLVHPDDRETVRDAMVAATDPGGSGTINLDYRIRRANDGVLRWIEVFGQAFFEDGVCTRFVGVVSDVTDRREAVDRLVRQEETLRLAIDAADVGTWDHDLETGEVRLSDRCYAMFGVTPGEPVTHETLMPFTHPADVVRVQEAVARALDPAIRADYAIEFRVNGRDDHVERWLSAKGEVSFDNEGRPRRFLGAVVNITERKRAELHLRLLVNELNHRVKNSLATIQAIAAQSFNGQRDMDEAKEAFSNRIVALAEAHDLLTRENWEGAEMHDVAARVAALHGGDARFELSGVAIRLSPKTALSLSMALHELATNAVKYGALSVPEGVVRIVWDMAPEPGAPRLDLTWTERGGPPVTPPQRRGFGSRLIERGLAAELAGAAVIDFQPEGVVCRIRALLEA
ncbi:PAS domain S-box protein [Caulobacter vibrioides]|uniref:PAS domain-containing protein n=1 Tax=Caulobacter vibrioides TaxID=155892 RepID=UPI000BB514A8|nr:PAS domain-containing protein [Caulobacter vibrioides]ATC23802.1 PAS domain S-box protein [Caulobacter vibrioides]AZH12044.1 PAS domain S-box protein [Caulobacter vibrioides]PLR15990.1 PAS domain S-box protein [Caulobacter vibrioides]